MPKYFYPYKYLNIFYFLWTIIFSLEYLAINNQVGYTNFLEIQLLLFYSFILYKAIKRYGLLDFFTIFLLVLALFSFMGIFFSIFTSHSYKQTPTFIDTDYPEDITQKVILIYLLFLGTIHLSYNYFSHKNKLLESKVNTVSEYITEKSTDKFLFNIGKKIMIVFFCFVFYRSYLEVQLLLGDRGLLYILGTSNLGLPTYLRYFTAIFQSGYLFILASYPPKKQFLKYSIIYVLILMPGMIIGNRAEFAVTLLFLIWYLYKMYNQKFNYLKLFISGIGFVMLFQIIAIVRVGDKVVVNTFELITTFFTYQSSSLDVLELYIEHKNDLEGLNLNYPFILDPLVAGFTGLSGQSLEVLETRSSLGHHLIYLLNPEYYLSGFSGGTTSIAELYQFGILGVSIGAIFL